MLDLLTRLAVAVGYLVVATWVLLDVKREEPKKRPARVFLGVVMLIWGVWYIALGLLDPPFQPWSALNRTRHIPLIAAIVTNLYIGRKVRDGT